MSGIVGPIFAIDLGVRTGFAVGAPGTARPDSGAVILKRKDEPARTAAGNLIAFLHERFSARCPSMFVMASPPTIPWHAAAHSREETAWMQYGLPMICLGMCDRFGIPSGTIAESTVRKHFIGVGRTGNREATKLTVISRCVVLGLLPRGSDDDDQADSIALWDWACSTYGRRSVSTSSLHLFGESNGRSASSDLRGTRDRAV